MITNYNDGSDNCDYNFGTFDNFGYFDNFGVKNEMWKRAKIFGQGPPSLPFRFKILITIITPIIVVIIVTWFCNTR